MNSATRQGGARAALDAHLETMPQAGFGKGFNDQALPKAARLAKLAGLSEEEAVQEILRTQSGAKRDVDGEVRSTVERIYADDSDHREKKSPRWPERDKSLIDQVLGKDAEGKKAPSAEPGLEQRPTMEYIEFLFDGDPLVTVGEKALSQDGEESIPSTTTLLSRLAELPRTFEYIVPSPAIKRQGKAKDGEPSRHCMEMYPKRLYLVVEFDGTPKPEAARILHHLDSFAPLVMIVDSGGKSLHGFFCCSDADEQSVLRFFKYAIRLGADPKMHSVMQFARMPNGIRSGTRAKQPVLYWNPKAKGLAWNLDSLPDELRVFSILEIPEEENPEASNLLGDRFLSRGKAMEFVGPTGVGKSTLVVQAGLLWSAGRDYSDCGPRSHCESFMCRPRTMIRT